MVDYAIMAKTDKAHCSWALSTNLDQGRIELPSAKISYRRLHIIVSLLFIQPACSGRQDIGRPSSFISILVQEPCICKTQPDLLQSSSPFRRD